MYNQFDNTYIKILFYMRQWPIVRFVASNRLFNEVAMYYDITSTFIEAH